MSNARGQDGFTLIENLVALAILGLALAVFAQIISTQTSSARRIDSAIQSILFARSILERLGHDLPLVPGNTSGAFDEAGSWQLKVAALGSTGTATSAPLAYAIELDVRQAGSPPIAFTTIRLAQ